MADVKCAKCGKPCDERDLHIGECPRCQALSCGDGDTPTRPPHEPRDNCQRITKQMVAEMSAYVASRDHSKHVPPPPPGRPTATAHRPSVLRTIMGWVVGVPLLLVGIALPLVVIGFMGSQQEKTRQNREMRYQGMSPPSPQSSDALTPLPRAIPAPDPRMSTAAYQEKMRRVREELIRLEVVLEDLDPHGRAREIKTRTEAVIAEARIAMPKLTEDEKARESFRSLELALESLGRLQARIAWVDEQERAIKDRIAKQDERFASARTLEEQMEAVKVGVASTTRNLEAAQEVRRKAESGDLALALGCVSATIKQLEEGK